MPKRILLADDRPRLVAGMQTALELAGMQVDLAQSLDEARRLSD
jgi:DNA-binding response OmpR family regulator